MHISCKKQNPTFCRFFVPPLVFDYVHASENQCPVREWRWCQWRRCRSCCDTPEPPRKDLPHLFLLKPLLRNRTLRTSPTPFFARSISVTLRLSHFHVKELLAIKSSAFCLLLEWSFVRGPTVLVRNSMRKWYFLMYDSVRCVVYLNCVPNTSRVLYMCM